jgi:ankyrin repeat protein
MAVSGVAHPQDGRPLTPYAYKFRQRLLLEIISSIFPVSKVTLCLDNGADANVLKSNWNTPLHLAAVCGDEEIAKLLLGKERL